MLLRILNLAQKEFIQFFRDRQMVFFIAFGTPIMLVLVAGATQSHITSLPMAVIDLDRSAESRSLITLLDSLDTLKQTQALDSLDKGQDLLDRGQVAVVVTIPPDFATALNNPNQTAQVQVWTDGSNLLVGITARSATEQAISRFGAQMVYKRWPGRERPSPVDLRARVRFNPELSGSYNAIPAQFALVVYLVALLVSSAGLSREHERGTMEQLMVTPLERIELVLGKAIPVILIAMVDFLIMLTITVGVYDVPMRGSMAALSLITLTLVTAEIGWGMMISAVSSNQQQSLLLVFMMGIFDMAFSGYLVSVENMPTALQWVSNLVPIRHYIHAIRTIMIKGGGLAEVQPQLTALVILDGVIVSLAVINLRRRLD